MAEKRESVTDTVTMYALREKGKNVHCTKLTYFLDEAEEWLKDREEEDEIVVVQIKPLSKHHFGEK